MSINPRTPATQRLWLNVRRGPASACWPWTGPTEDGYGRLRIGGGRRTPAHRLAYSIVFGPVPEGMVLDHLCRNRACCNPAHLEVVDNRTNLPADRQRRAASHGSRRACRHHHRSRRHPHTHRHHQGDRMTTTDTERCDDALESISNRLRDVKAKLVELRELEADLEAQALLYTAGAVGTITAHGKAVLEVSVGRRFSPDLARETLASNPEILAAISETVVSATKAKAVLPPNVYELCQRPNGKPTVKPVAAAQ